MLWESFQLSLVVTEQSVRKSWGNSFPFPSTGHSNPALSILHSQNVDSGTFIVCPTVDINVWAQTDAYVLIAMSEIFASTTSLEYAFSKAPKHMRSLVQAFALFMSAISAAIGEAFVALSADPLLFWNCGTMAALSLFRGTLFYIQDRQLDEDDDRLNMFPTGNLVVGKDVEDTSVVSQSDDAKKVVLGDMTISFCMPSVEIEWGHRFKSNVRDTLPRLFQDRIQLLILQLLFNSYFLL